MAISRAATTKANADVPTDTCHCETSSQTGRGNPHPRLLTLNSQLLTLRRCRASLNSMMTYKLNPELKKIHAPIVLRFADGTADMSFPDGQALAVADFGKNYLTDSLCVENNTVVLTLRENDTVNVVNWIGEEAVCFF